MANREAYGEMTRPVCWLRNCWSVHRSRGVYTQSHAGECCHFAFWTCYNTGDDVRP